MVTKMNKPPKTIKKKRHELEKKRVPLSEDTNQKRVAVVLYGEARHIKETARSIREYFDIDGCKVDFLYHSWPYIGHGWKDEKKKRYLPKKKEIEDLYQELYEPVAGYVSEDDTDVVYFCKKINDMISPIDRLGRGFFEFGKTSTTFAIGQFFSLGKVINEKIKYEKKHNFTYDAVFRIRTDMFFLGREFYKNEQHYHTLKQNRLDLITENPNHVIGDWFAIRDDVRQTYFEVSQLDFCESTGDMLIDPYGDSLQTVISEKNGISKLVFQGKKEHDLKIENTSSFLVAGRELAASSSIANACWGNMPEVYLCMFFENFTNSYLGRKPFYGIYLWGEAIEANCILRNKIGWKKSTVERLHHKVIIKNQEKWGSHNIYVGSHDEMTEQAKNNTESK